MQAFFQILEPSACVSSPSRQSSPGFDNEPIKENMTRLKAASSFLYKFAQSITVLEENHRLVLTEQNESTTHIETETHFSSHSTATFESVNKSCSYTNNRDSGFVEEITNAICDEQSNKDLTPKENVEETKGRNRMKERGRTMRIKDRGDVQRFLGSNKVTVRREVSPNIQAKIKLFEKNGNESEIPSPTKPETLPTRIHRSLSRMNAVPLQSTNGPEAEIELPTSPTINVDPPQTEEDEPKIRKKIQEDQESISSGGSGSYVDTNNVRRTLWGQGRQKSLWSDLPEVKESGILDRLSASEKWLQESMFEVMISEAMYHHQLTVLVQHFMQSPHFSGPSSILSKREKRQLFSDVVLVKKASEALLGDLEAQWLSEGILISDVSDVLYAHATNNFDCYIKYCSNQVYQERMLKELRNENAEFVEVLQRLESDPACMALPLQSFLMLPIQRITRFPLLLSSIHKQLPPGSPQLERCQRALDQVKKAVQDCNEGARKMEQLEEMLVVSNQLEFACDVHAFPILSSSRFLVKQEAVQQVVLPDSISKQTLRSIFCNSLWFFLFNDLFIVAKKKGNSSYLVKDYCPRNKVFVQELGCLSHLCETLKVLFYTSYTSSIGNKVKEMVISCKNEEERRQWLSVLRSGNDLAISPGCSPTVNQRRKSSDKKLF